MVKHSPSARSSHTSSDSSKSPRPTHNTSIPYLQCGLPCARRGTTPRKKGPTTITRVKEEVLAEAAKKSQGRKLNAYILPMGRQSGVGMSRMKKSTLAVDTRGSVTRTPGVEKRDAKTQSAKKKAKIYAIGTCLPKRHDLGALLANKKPGIVNVGGGLDVNGMEYWKAPTTSRHVDRPQMGIEYPEDMMIRTF